MTDTAEVAPGKDMGFRHHPMPIAGMWEEGARRMPVHDPEDGRIVATVARASVEEAMRAVEAADRARVVARGLPVHERVRILSYVARRLEGDADAFATLIATEGVKTIREARLEAARAVTTLRLSAEEAGRLAGETIAFDQRPGSERRFGYTVREPVGVILAITPFNDPLNLVAHKIGPAIAAGNAVILKPHERTPLTSLRLARLFEEAGLPEGVLQVVTGYGAEIGEPMIADRRVRMVSFTGGPVTGRRIVAAAGIRKIALELGGNGPVIVMPDADLDRAVEACVSGAFWAAGQNCLHVQRIFLHRDIHAEARALLIDRTEALRLGRKLDEATDMGCLIDEAAGRRLNAAVSSAIEAGARLATGGFAKRTHMPPTLVENVPDGHPLAAEEAFGPVTLLAPFDRLDEALARANGTEYGLHAAIFTKDVETAFAGIAGLECGAVMVNDSTDYRIDAMPFGGVKGSGLGREGVRSAALDMTEVKVVCFNRA